MKTFYSNGKLLLTGEYVVLDGAFSLAIPTKYGQSLIVEEIDEPKISWTSLNDEGNIWFEDEFILNNNEVLKSTNNNTISKRLNEILNIAKTLNPIFLNPEKGVKVTTKLDFPRDWGLGTSSTLINNIAQWANVDAYQLLKNSFGGSGYDIACAQNNTPITYQLQNDNPLAKAVDFNPDFKEHLYFVHLNKKQNSRDGIKHYRDSSENLESAIKEISGITLKILTSNSLRDFENLINSHETIISKITKQTTAKDLLFSDYEGSIKSLGAWGGDFILVTSQGNPTNYFVKKGYNTVIPYSDTVL
ncbi:GHMP kinase [Sabulilitoribacter multivorans]|uniref:GHMP kinase n=1 Tax=Flaviramulus multivorans TaxID=1304750 RepID=A0ABS9IKA3_9FLAO|nr:GHMP kinase [Flaviramulus multivorans]